MLVGLVMFGLAGRQKIFKNEWVSVKLLPKQHVRSC